MTTKYRMLADSAIEPKAKKGTVVYQCRMPDYGLARDDTRITGILHGSFTLKEDGGYPSFTVPVRDVERVEE